MELKREINSQRHAFTEDIKEPKVCSASVDCEGTLQSDNDEKENLQQEAKLNSEYQSKDTSGPNQEVNQIQPPGDENFHNDNTQEEEPAAKKRRIAASAFLQVSDPVQNTIPENISEDIKQYQASWGFESGPFHPNVVRCSAPS